MRTKDITIGQTYAVAGAWEWKRPLHMHTGYGQADRAEVVATEVPRLYRMVTKNDGIEVRLLDPTTGEVLLDGEGNERRKVVRSAEVRQEWDSYVVVVNDAVATAAYREQWEQDHRAATLARITEALGIDSTDELNSDPFPRAVRGVARTHAKEVRLSLDALATLLELAHEAGERD